MRRATRGPAMAGVLLLTLLALTISPGSAGCVGRQLAEIEASRLSDHEKAQASLYAAESAWVQAKAALADVLTDLELAGVGLTAGKKSRIRLALAAGNLAIKQAHVELERGAGSAAEVFAETLQSLQAATQALITATGGLRR